MGCAVAGAGVVSWMLVGGVVALDAKLREHYIAR